MPFVMGSWREYFRALAICSIVNREPRPILAQVTIDGSAVHYTPFPVSYAFKPVVVTGWEPPDGGEPMPLERKIVPLYEMRKAG